MSANFYTFLGNGITCIDVGYVRPQLAAFYMMEHEGEVAIIETGTSNSIPRLMKLLDEKGIGVEQVRYVIPTHVHLDHAGGAGGLMKLLPQASLIVHPRGARHLIDPSRLIEGTIAVYGEEKYAELYGEILPVEAERVIEAEDGLELDLNGRKLLIRHTPGHADHHFCVWDETSRGWFTGDNFGLSYREMIGPESRYIIPTTTPVQFNPEKLLASLDLLMSYQPERMYLTHFGLLEAPQDYVGILRDSIQAYVAIAESHADAADPAVAISRDLASKEETALLRVVPEMSAEQASELLAIDNELSGQGLAIWLKRRAG